MTVITGKSNELTNHNTTAETALQQLSDVATPIAANP
jgi:hypothetical protein